MRLTLLGKFVSPSAHARAIVEAGTFQMDGSNEQQGALSRTFSRLDIHYLEIMNTRNVILLPRFQHREQQNLIREDPLFTRERPSVRAWAELCCVWVWVWFFHFSAVSPSP